MTHVHHLTSHRGFTLLETVVATGVLVTALAGVAQLLVLGSQLTRQANASGVALLAAQNKMEELRGATFAFDAGGVPVTAGALQPSSSTSLSEDTPPYQEWLDDSGERVDDASSAAFTRRWRITTVVDESPDAIAIEVCVFAAARGGDDPQFADACLSTVRTRQP